MAVYLTPPDLRDCIFFYQLDPKGVYCKIRVADGRQKEKQIDCNVSAMCLAGSSKIFFHCFGIFTYLPQNKDVFFRKLHSTIVTNFFFPFKD